MTFLSSGELYPSIKFEDAFVVDFGVAQRQEFRDKDVGVYYKTRISEKHEKYQSVGQQIGLSCVQKCNSRMTAARRTDMWSLYQWKIS